MTITRPEFLTGLTLATGSHRNPNAGVCLLEAVAYVAGEPHTDHPACASPILSAFGRSLNDALPDDKRQRLVPLVPQIVGTAGDTHDQARALMAADWLIRAYTPTWLRLAGLNEAAASLERLPRQASWDDIKATVPVACTAEEQAAARAAVVAAAGEAASGATRAAAAFCARDAVAVASHDAAVGASWDDAFDAADMAAWHAARVAAPDDARDTLAPTVDALQNSAIDLFARMIRPEVTR